jgi:hypothetical protein
MGIVNRRAELDPLREDAQRGYIRRLIAAGEVAAARVAFDDLARRLRRELGQRGGEMRRFGEVDYYAVLEVKSSATRDEIRTSYRLKVRDAHVATGLGASEARDRVASPPVLR